MKLLFDQNLSRRLVQQLNDLYPGSQHVANAGLDTSADAAVWNYARDGGFVIVSKDSDFMHRSLVFGPPPKIVLLRLGNCTTAEVEQLLRAEFSALQEFELDDQAAILVLP